MTFVVTQLPEKSKLMLIGDWFQHPGEGWKVVCYFQSPNSSLFRKSLPIDFLPALITGEIYPLTDTVNEKKRFTDTFVLPKRELWELLTYADMPQSLQRVWLLKEFKQQIEHQLIYKIELKKFTMWLPLNELARAIFFQSAEIVRTSAMEGNTNQLAKAEENNRTGKITFESHVPLNFIHSIQYRKFFAWLMFDESAQKSFGSIFNCINRESEPSNNARRWTFDFEPPNIENCSITWSGYTGSEERDEHHHRYVREIRSISDVPSPELEMVEFEHPEDKINIEKDINNDNPNSRNVPHLLIEPKEVDCETPPKSTGKRYVLNINRMGFHFDTDIELLRGSREHQVLSKGEQSDLKEEQEEDVVGITQGKKTGKNARSDTDNLEPPILIKASEKLMLFEIMLKTLCDENKWKLTVETGMVPKENCRSAHLVDDRARRFCYAKIKIREEFTVFAIEIELKDNETLSTLFYRCRPSELIKDKILQTLMSSDSERNQKSMQWDREQIKELTASVCFLGHPDKKDLNEDEVNQSWATRAKHKLLTL